LLARGRTMELVAQWCRSIEVPIGLLSRLVEKSSGQELSELVALLMQRIRSLKESIARVPPSVSVEAHIEEEIMARLMSPLERMFELMDDTYGGDGCQHHPKIRFWASELHFGFLFILEIVAGESDCSPTPGRLLQCSSMDGELRIHNTFICNSTSTTHGAKRSHSAPARLVETAVPALCPKIEHAVSWQVAGPGISTNKVCQQSIRPSLAVESTGSTCDKEQRILLAGNHITEVRSNTPKTCSVKRSLASGSQVTDPGQQQHGSNPPPSPLAVVEQPRWWGNVPDVCPITTFPVCLLPYPPFRFPTPGRKERFVLIDGGYLVARVLAQWDFQALGRTLDDNDMQKLDAYIRRCKLGRFSLTRALRLFSLGTTQAAQEVSRMRRAAASKLKHLQHVQKMRQSQTPTAAPLISMK